MRGFADSWMRYWFEPEEPFNLAVCRILCFWGLFVLHFQYDLSAWAAPPDPFWIPIPLFDSLNLTRPSAEVLFAMGLVWKLSLLASCIGLFTRASIVTAAVLGLYLLGLPHNFGKVDHNNAIEFFVFMIHGCLTVWRCAVGRSLDRTAQRKAVSSHAERRVQVARALCMARFRAHLLRSRVLETEELWPGVGLFGLLPTTHGEH